MLVLHRRIREQIRISPEIVITVVEASASKVLLGFSAPPEIWIYRGEVWDQIMSECKPIEIRMIKKSGKCRHDVGDVFRYDTFTRRPEGACKRLLHVASLFAWRMALSSRIQCGHDELVLFIHCPASSGTVWEMRRIAAPGDRPTGADLTTIGHGIGKRHLGPRSS